MSSNISKLRTWLRSFNCATQATKHFLCTRCPVDVEYYYEHKHPGHNDSDDNRCVVCESQYRTLYLQDFWHDSHYVYANAIDDAGAQEVLSTFVTSIQDDLAALRIAVADHGNTLLSRWKKKSRVKKAELLRSVYPDIPEKKSAQADLLYGEKYNWCGKKDYRKAWLLPWVTIDGLVEDKISILHVIDQRAAKDLDEWTLSDNEHLTTVWDIAAVRVQFNSKCVVVCGADYGKLVSYSFEACHELRNIGYPRARLLLEAQAELYGLLRRVVETLLDGANSGTGQDKWLAALRDNAAFAEDGNNTAKVSLPTPVALRPPAIALEDICEMVEARRRAAEDELWSLQTDVPYFQHLVKAEQKTGFAKALDAKERSKLTVQLLIYRAIDSYDLWTSMAWLCNRISDVKKQASQLQSSSIGHGLDWVCRMSSLGLQRFSADAIQMWAEKLGIDITRCGAFEQHYDFKVLDDGRVAACTRDEDDTIETRTYCRSVRWWRH
jgi:hypothetical protein